MGSDRAEFDAFDRGYRDRIRDAVWKTIIDESRDPATNMAPIRNYKIYDALHHVQAMILASWKEAGSPPKTREISSDFAKRLHRLVAELKKSYDRNGVPFDVIYSEEIPWALAPPVGVDIDERSFWSVAM